MNKFTEEELDLLNSRLKIKREQLQKEYERYFWALRYNDLDIETFCNVEEASNNIKIHCKVLYDKWKEHYEYLKLLNYDMKEFVRRLSYSKINGTTLLDAILTNDKTIERFEKGR